MLYYSIFFPLIKFQIYLLASEFKCELELGVVCVFTYINVKIHVIKGIRIS